MEAFCTIMQYCKGSCCSPELKLVIQIKSDQIVVPTKAQDASLIGLNGLDATGQIHIQIEHLLTFSCADNTVDKESPFLITCYNEGTYILNCMQDTWNWQGNNYNTETWSENLYLT